MWLIGEGQRPVVVFTVEESDPSRLLASSMQWSGSSTEPKAWLHLCILLGGSDTVLPLPGNTRLYNALDIGRLSRDLDDVAAHAKRLLGNLPKGGENARITLRGTTKLGEGVSLFAAEGSDDEETEAVVLKPSRKVVPLDISCGVVTFEGALMRLVEADEGHMLFSTEHRNYPFVFRFSTGSTFDLWFDVDKSNLVQWLVFSELVEATKSSALVTLSGPSGGIASFRVG